jgi:hypothetical protein
MSSLQGARRHFRMSVRIRWIRFSLELAIRLRDMENLAFGGLIHSEAAQATFVFPVNLLNKLT